ncbi:MAG: hypothetical protein AAGI66_08135 [Cyanobacteria bacterium P01_H01_bin.74]
MALSYHQFFRAKSASGYNTGRNIGMIKKSNIALDTLTLKLAYHNVVNYPKQSLGPVQSVKQAGLNQSGKKEANHDSELDSQSDSQKVSTIPTAKAVTDRHNNTVLSRNDHILQPAMPSETLHLARLASQNGSHSIPQNTSGRTAAIASALDFGSHACKLPSEPQEEMEDSNAIPVSVREKFDKNTRLKNRKKISKKNKKKAQAKTQKTKKTNQPLPFAQLRQVAAPPQTNSGPQEDNAIATSLDDLNFDTQGVNLEEKDTVVLSDFLHPQAGDDTRPGKNKNAVLRLSGLNFSGSKLSGTLLSMALISGTVFGFYTLFQQTDAVNNPFSALAFLFSNPTPSAGLNKSSAATNGGYLLLADSPDTDALAEGENFDGDAGPESRFIATTNISTGRDDPFKPLVYETDLPEDDKKSPVDGLFYTGYVGSSSSKEAVAILQVNDPQTKAPSSLVKKLNETFPLNGYMATIKKIGSNTITVFVNGKNHVLQLEPYTAILSNTGVRGASETMPGSGPAGSATDPALQEYEG